MRRRISLVGTGVAVLALMTGVGAALAATNHKQAKAAKPEAILLTCTISLSTVPPQGQTNVDQPPTQGDTYGPVDCKNAAFGSGMAHTSFTVPDSGDTVGKYQEYLDTGMLSGAFDITPNEAPPLSDTGFYSQTWTGTIAVDHATGAFAGVRGKKGAGVLNCSTQDSGVHMICHERIRLEIPPPSASSKRS